MATKFHEGRSGDMSRCEATVRHGGGVKGCFAGDGKGGHFTHTAMAWRAGDSDTVIQRSDGNQLVSKVDEETGLYSVRKADGSRASYFDAETGAAVGWRDQRSGVQRDLLGQRAAVAGPAKDIVEVNEETPEQLRQWFGEFKRLHGVEVNEYNKEEVVDTMIKAHDATVHIPSTGDEVKDRSNYAVFMKKAVLNLVVFERSPDEAVNMILRERMWGPYKKKYRRGR